MRTPLTFSLNLIRRWAPTVIAALLLFALSPIGTRAQNTVLNYFAQADANGNNVLNLGGDGALKFDGKLTDIDHGVATLNSNGYSGVITTNLTSIVDCPLSLKSGSVPTVTTVTALFTTGAGTIELFAWKPTSSSVTTLVPASAAVTVSWACFGT